MSSNVVLKAATPRPMSRYKQKRLTQLFCQRQVSYLWGKKRFIKPVLLPFVWGDGKRIMAIRPITTRRDHFVVAVDSSITHEEHLHDIIDVIYKAHEDYFGFCQCSTCCGEESVSDFVVFKQWPVICTNGGCEWWFLRQPKK